MWEETWGGGRGKLGTLSSFYTRQPWFGLVMHKFFSADMDGYISKPIDFKACLKLVEETIL